MNLPCVCTPHMQVATSSLRPSLSKANWPDLTLELGLLLEIKVRACLRHHE